MEEAIAGGEAGEGEAIIAAVVVVWEGLLGESES